MSWKWLCIICLGICLQGCDNGPMIASVEGTVTMDGRPLADTTIIFTPPDGRPSGSWTDSAGHYVLNFSEGRQGAIPGPNRVVVTTRRAPFLGPDGKVVPARKEMVPMKYNTKTTLTYEVVEGQKNIANFELDSKGPIAVAPVDE